MPRRSRKEALEDLWNKVYPPSARKKEPEQDHVDDQENGTQKRDLRRGHITGQEESMQSKENGQDHTDNHRNDARKRGSRRGHITDQEESTQSKENEQSYTNGQSDSAQEEQYVCTLYRIKERFYTPGGKVAHISEDKPAMIALMRLTPISKDAECSITVDTEDAN